ncbi:MAG: hypothetical protein U0586_07530 [Candidatus Brocadiaceae bacterium]
MRFVDKASDLGNPDLLIIPGTKNTIEDLLFLMRRGISDGIIRLSKGGTMIMGILQDTRCSENKLTTPIASNHRRKTVNGLGLLSTITTFARNKQTYQVRARLLGCQRLFHVAHELVGYEIHMGETPYNGNNSIKPFARITERAGKTVDVLDGCISPDGNVAGTTFTVSLTTMNSEQRSFNI